MNSRCKIILGFVLFTLIVGIAVYYIRTDLSEAAVTSETNIVLSNENNKNYLSSMVLGDVLIEREDLSANGIANSIAEDILVQLEQKKPLVSALKSFNSVLSSAENSVNEISESFVGNVYPLLVERVVACHVEEAAQLTADRAESYAAYLNEKYERELNETTAELFAGCFATIDAKIEKYLNVRSEPNGEVVGILYPQTGGDLLEIRDGWACINSGNLTGWVSMEYIAIGTDVTNAGPTIYVTVEADTLMMRQEPSTTAAVINKLPMGYTAHYLGHTAGWVYVDCDGVQGYVSADYVRLTIGDGVAVTLDEQLWMEMLQEAGMLSVEPEPVAPVVVPETPAEVPTAETAPQETGVQPSPAAPTADEQARQRIDAIIAEGRSTMPAMYLSADEIYLLASVIMMEAGNESYAGKLAVAGVVLNRIRSGYWGSTLAAVVYAPGQFSGANTGLLAGYMQSGPNAESIQAAYEACAGVHNIGGYLFFCSTKNAHLEQFSSYYIIDKQCFYAR